MSGEEYIDVSKEILDEIVRRLVEALQPDRIYLFGSRANGSPNVDSDVDLIVCATPEMERWSRVGCNLLHSVAETGQEVYAPGERAGSGMASPRRR